jgi:hypothetical protein
MRMSSLPDDAFPEAVNVRDPAGDCVIGATKLEDFIAERVREHRTQ